MIGLRSRWKAIGAGAVLAAIAAVVLLSADSRPPERTPSADAETGTGTETEVLSVSVTDQPTATTTTVPGTPSLAASPATGLGDGQTVHLTGEDFEGLANLAVLQCTSAPTVFADCAIDAVSQDRADAAGDLVGTRRVHRQIRTENAGTVDCGVVACVVAAATLDPVRFATAPLAFAEITDPPPPFRIELTGPHGLDHSGAATLLARLRCDRDLEDLVIRFDVTQSTPRGEQSDRLAVDCAAGEDVIVFSDLLPGLAVGPATASVSVSAPDGVAITEGTIDIVGPDAVIAEIRARLDDPSDTTVISEFISGLRFRVGHNPRFAHTFITAILRSTPRS